MVIELDEDIGVKNIRKLYLQLKEIIHKEPDIILDLKKVKRIDLSLVQVIFAVNRELMKKERMIMLKSVSKEIREQLYLAGFAAKPEGTCIKTEV
jgi:anti-anti-sigma regulatory factor